MEENNKIQPIDEYEMQSLNTKVVPYDSKIFRFISSSPLLLFEQEIKPLEDVESYAQLP